MEQKRRKEKMYINETYIGCYAVSAILGILVGLLIDWVNTRLSDGKRVFSKDIINEYFVDFKPKYKFRFN